MQFDSDDHAAHPTTPTTVGGIVLQVCAALVTGGVDDGSFGVNEALSRALSVGWAIGYYYDDLASGIEQDFGDITGIREFIRFLDDLVRSGRYKMLLASNYQEGGLE